MHPSASLRGSRGNTPIEFPQSGEKADVWPALLLQHIVYNSDAIDLKVATARTRSCGRRLTCICLFTSVETQGISNARATLTSNTQVSSNSLCIAQLLIENAYGQKIKIHKSQSLTLVAV
ncbi:hypothetical protein AVEN_141614-1 [Araneus ventricosus]|uniref:Uncharacterized protein n=1 Tax=Araneus ventricosus TaxID=182803 RepID=A0A4Y2KK80_ARAVE|nr:hypothetical protein AVEN_141614-1 [Araneus ventricosus]